MSTKKAKIKIFSIIIVLLLLTISVSSVVWSADYNGLDGITTIVNSEDPANMIDKTIHLGFGELKSSDYLYCLEQGQTIWTVGSDYNISVLIEIEGEKATARYKDSNKNIVTKTNSNMYNAVLALILNSEEAVKGEGMGHGNVGDHGDNGTTAQKSMWKYFPYWIANSAAKTDGGLGITNSWCSANKTSIDDNAYINSAQQKYANGDRANATIYLLKSSNSTEAWQNLMIAIPEGVTPPENDLVIKKVDQDTKATLGGVQFTVKNNKGEFLIASGPNTNNIYTITGYTKNENEATKFKTAKDPYKDITIKAIPDGEYTVKEVNNSNIGYKVNVGKEYSINKTDIANNAACVITLENDRTKKLIIEKIGQPKSETETVEKLGAVEFIIWNDNNKFIKATGPDSNNTYSVTGYVDSANDATRFVTGDIGGYKPIIIEDLVDGNYTIREVYNANVNYQENEGKQWKKVKLDESTEQEYVEFVLDNAEGDDLEQPKPTTVPGRITISGFVWEDINDAKSNQIVDSIYNGEDKLVQGIKVFWKDANGEIIDQTETKEDGSYEFVMEFELNNHNFDKEDEAKLQQIKEKVNGSYIEFDYNGFKYTTVANASDITKENMSQGIEIDEDRNSLDNKFDMIEDEKIVDLTQNGRVETSIKEKDAVTKLIEPNYSEDYAVTATTNKITNMLNIAEGQDGWTKKTTFCTEHCKAEVRTHEIGRIELKDEATGATATIVVYCYGRPVVENWNDPTGVLEEKIQSYMKTPKGEELNNEIYDAQYFAAEEKETTIGDCLNGKEQIYEWNIKNVNLGLILREQPDIALVADIEKVRVIMKGQEYTYIYGNKGLQDKTYDYTVKFENKYIVDTYSRPVNPADVAYINHPDNAQDSDALKVYVTYHIAVNNGSDTLYMKPLSIVNYYDSNYTIYTGENSATSTGWTSASDEIVENNGDKYKVAYNNSLNNVVLEPHKETELLKIEFQVGQETVKQLQNKDALLKNVSEVLSYTTYYGPETRCAELEFAKENGKYGENGNLHVYAGADADAIPGNAIPGNAETYESDTDEAPRFLLCKDTPENDPKYEYKMISGTVWEDTQTTESKNKNERLGDGVKAESEKGIENVKVELLEANENGTIKLDTDGNAIIAKLYRIENGESKSKQAITYTNSDGYFSFGNNNSDSPEGVITDYYIIRYTYGDNTKISGTTINGRNYKSTIITTEPIKSVMKGTSSNEKWHLSTPDNGSIAIDDLNDRLDIPSLNYSNFDETVTISAYSKSFKLQLEYTAEQTEEVEADGETIKNSTEKLPDDCTVFDFGIIERPREDIIIDKTISHVRLTLGDTGQELINGNPKIDEMDYVKKMGFSNIVNSREIFNQRKATGEDDKVLTMEIDSETLLGSTLEVTYEITVTNNSEIDYEYSEDSQYYYYGENPTNQIKESVEYVVDYLDSEVVLRKEEGYEHNNVWEVVSGGNIDEVANQLKDAGLISYKLNNEDTDKTYEAIRKGGYTVFKTNAFANLARGTSQTEKLSISKELANENEQQNSFENHVEILQLNGKIARTIDSVKDDTREQVVKTYKPGNYMPNLANRIYDDNGTLVKSGLHQQDDDRVRIVITPPTGATNYITSYIITIAIGLIVMVGGIIFIKKKVINK